MTAASVFSAETTTGCIPFNYKSSACFLSGKQESLKGFSFPNNLGMLTVLPLIEAVCFPLVCTAEQLTGSEVSRGRQGTQLHLLSSVCSARPTFANLSNLFGRAVRRSGIFGQGFEGRPGELDWEQMSGCGDYLLLKEGSYLLRIDRQTLCSLQSQKAGIWLVFFKAIHLRVFPSVNPCLT